MAKQTTNKDILIKPIPYLWNKNWVRPYESVYSIIRNFCNVNALNGEKAMHLLGYYSTGCANYRFLLQTMDYYLEESDENIICKDILPDWYISENEILDMNFYSSYKNIFNDKICYCPKCEKENYHSYLHQIKGLKHCPFHRGTKIIETNDFYNIRSIKSISKNYNNKEMILPIKRKLKSCFYKNLYAINLFKQHVCIIPYYTSPECYCEHYFDFLKGNDPDKKWTVALWETDDYQIIKESIIEWINSQRMPKDILGNYSDGIVTIPRSIFSCGIVDAAENYIYKKICDIFNQVENYNMTLIHKNVRFYEPLNHSPQYYLPLFYIWYMLKTQYPLDGLNRRWIDSPYSVHCELFINTETVHYGPFIIKLIDITKNGLRSLFGVSNSRIVNPLISIIDDYFDSQYEEIRKHFDYYGKFTVFELSERLPIPEYYTFINDEGNLEIWRYNRKPVKSGKQ